MTKPNLFKANEQIDPINIQDKEQIKANVMDCTLSLFYAIQNAGGVVNSTILEMEIGEFITEIAAPNGIRFVHISE